MITRTNIQLDAVVIPRSLFQDKSFNQGKVNDLFAFIDLIQMATLDEKIVTIKGIPVKLERGEIATSTRILSERWGWSVNATTNALLRYEKQGRVIRRKSNLTSIISITNFDQYVANPNADEYTKWYADGYAEGISSHAHDELNIFNNTYKPSFQSESDKSKAKEDVEKKEKHTLLSHASHDDLSVSFSDAADRLYAMYPSSVKRADGSRRTLRCNSDKNKIIRLLKNGHTEKELADKIKTYLSEQPGEYTRMLSTFLNNLPDYSEPEETKPEEEDWRESKNTFWKKDFDEHPDEFKAMDYELRRIINRGMPLKWENGKWIKG